MNRNKETVFEVGAEGGSIAIIKLQTKEGKKFIYHHNEMDFTDEGLGVNINHEYKDFETPFQVINQKYSWYNLHLVKVDEEFANYVTTELIAKLHQQGVTPEELRYSQQQLEKILKIKLKFGFMPIMSGMQNIAVTNLVKLTEYDYQEYTEESGLKPRIKGKYESFTTEFSPYNMEIIRDNENFKTTGKLEVQGNTILIKNEFNQIEFAFSSDKFFVSTTPILSQQKGWFYTNNY